MKVFCSAVFLLFCYQQVAHGNGQNRKLNELELKNAKIDPANFPEIGGHVYFIPPNNLSLWMNVLDAMEYCKGLGMKLASLETPEENKLVKKYLIDSGERNTPYWTSGHAFMRTFVWMNLAEGITYTDWSTDNPNDDMSTDVCIQVFGDRGWDDSDCGYSRLFICE